MEAKKARISKSVFGESYQVEYRIGNTLYYENFRTIDEAKRFCFRNSMNFKVI